MLVCSTCHGSQRAEVQPRKAFRQAAQRTHNFYAWAALPVEDMQLGKTLKTTKGKLAVAGGALLIGFLVVVPYVYTGFVFFPMAVSEGLPKTRSKRQSAGDGTIAKEAGFLL